MEIESNSDLEVSAYRTYDGDRLVVVAINPTDSPVSLQLDLGEGFSAKRAFQTDRTLNCQSVPLNSPLPPHSIRTFVCLR